MPKNMDITFFYYHSLYWVEHFHHLFIHREVSISFAFLYYKKVQENKSY